MSQEKVYKSMGHSGVTSIVLGIVIIAGAAAAGVLLLISGINVLSARKDVLI